MLSEEQRLSLEAAVAEYQSNLDEVLPYLDKRGLGRDIAVSERLGFVRNPTIPEHKSGRNRLAIPYLTPAGPVAIVFRCIEDHSCKERDSEVKKINKRYRHSKYTKPAGTVNGLFGVQSIITADTDIHVTEGEIDRHILHHCVGLPAVGVPGVDNWKPWWTEIFSDFQRVFVWSDGDDAGGTLTGKFVKELGQRVVPIALPPGHDINSLYLEKGADYLRGMAE